MYNVNYNSLTILHEALKQNRKIKYGDVDSIKIANCSKGVGYLEGKKINRIIFYLRGKGCEWSCHDNGGCFMCGHYFGTSQGKELPSGTFINQFKKEYKKHDFSEIPMICIYNAGSILNDKEIPNSELFEILKIVNENKNIKRIIIESRPEMIEDIILQKISEICDQTVIELGIGLETSNDLIREKCINKALSFKMYKNCVEKIKKYKNIKVLTYLTVKPLFLTISESIEDIIKTITEIKEYTDIISFEPTSIQKDTIVEFLYKKNIYTPPPDGWLKIFYWIFKN